MKGFFRDMLLAGGELGRRRFWLTGERQPYRESEEVRSWADFNRPLSREERAIARRLQLEDRQRGGL